MSETLLTEEQALEKARACVKEQFPDEDLKTETYTVEFEIGGMGETVMGLNEKCWLFVFPQSEEEVADSRFSDDVTVVVDAITGEAYWIPGVEAECII